METINKIDANTIEITKTDKFNLKKIDVENSIKQIEEEINKQKIKIDDEYKNTLDYLKDKLSKF